MTHWPAIRAPPATCPARPAVPHMICESGTLGKSLCPHQRRPPAQKTQYSLSLGRSRLISASIELQPVRAPPPARADKNKSTRKRDASIRHRSPATRQRCPSAIWSGPAPWSLNPRPPRYAHSTKHLSGMSPAPASPFPATHCHRVRLRPGILSTAQRNAIHRRNFEMFVNNRPKMFAPPGQPASCRAHVCRGATVFSICTRTWPFNGFPGQDAASCIAYKYWLTPLKVVSATSSGVSLG